ncbi:MAG TPA: alpha/beta hydrolase [Paraburkholderia sp.]|jgi:pimeloyl-ACP methyl ester carboxylesterase|nr:alpha/beta hydrolase [Paraburkholderia sp.]
MESNDDDLTQFALHGAPSLPDDGRAAYLEHDGARLWYAVFGAGTPLVLLHGGLGHSGNWGHQIHALAAAGHCVVTLDSRGHGRSTRDAEPYRYERMASDVLAVLDALGIARAALVGWSDGACTALLAAMQQPERVAGVLFFGCNMNPDGAKPFVLTPVIERCFERHKKDYAQLSATPDQFDAFVAAVSTMQQTQPDCSAQELAAVRVPVAIVHSEHDEFIRREHAEYLAQTIPGASLTVLPGVSHFAPLQRPARFNQTVLDFAAALR